MLHISKIKNSNSFYEIKDMKGNSVIITGFVEPPESLNEETGKQVKCEGQYGITFANKVTEKTVNYENVVLDEHGLREEACKMLHDLMPDSYDENMEPIYKEASPYAKLEEKCRREIERRRNKSNFITKAWNRFINTFSRN